MILGKACEKVLPAFQHVFSTGQPVVNFEIKAEVPKRRHPGHWIANYLPIRNRAGQVQEIGIVARPGARSVTPRAHYTRARFFGTLSP